VNVSAGVDIEGGREKQKEKSAGRRESRRSEGRITTPTISPNVSWDFLAKRVLNRPFRPNSFTTCHSCTVLCHAFNQTAVLLQLFLPLDRIVCRIFSRTSGIFNTRPMGRFYPPFISPIPTTGGALGRKKKKTVMGG